MVIVYVVGKLGSGKTLTQTYIAVCEWLTKRRKVYSNYHLKIPYYPVTSHKQVEEMRDGVFVADELWLWMDSREHGRSKNKVLNSILIKSRKRDIDIYYSAQDYMQTDARLRRVTNEVWFPKLHKNNTICRVKRFDHPSMIYLDAFNFKTKKLFNVYDTREEIEDIIGIEDKKKIKKKKKKKKS